MEVKVNELSKGGLLYGKQVGGRKLLLFWKATAGVHCTLCHYCHPELCVARPRRYDGKSDSRGLVRQRRQRRA